MACREFIEEKLDAGEIIYGTNTGAGEFSEIVLDRSTLQEYQKKMIYSHAAGIGKKCPTNGCVGPWPQELMFTLKVIQVAD